MSLLNSESIIVNTPEKFGDTETANERAVWDVLGLCKENRLEGSASLNSDNFTQLFGDLKITGVSQPQTIPTSEFAPLVVNSSDNTAEKEPVYTWSGLSSSDDPSTKFQRQIRYETDGTANVEISDPNGKQWKLHVQPDKSGTVSDNISPILDSAQQLDRNGIPTGWSIEKREGKLGLISPFSDKFQPVKVANYNDKNSRIYLLLENGDEVRIRNSGSATQYRNGLPIEMLDANGNSFKYEWKGGNDQNPASVFYRPVQSKELHEYRLNSGLFGSGRSLQNWSTDNYTLYKTLGAPGHSSAVTGEARIHVFAHDGDQDGSIRITTGTVGYLQYGLKETSTTWHADGTKTVDEKDYNRIWYDKDHPQRRFNRKNNLIEK
jgi:hypothetical protein